ncbi:hypothetical protein PDE_00947 [Penicillium oxalicum 114-2]|uniref:Sulfotransferase domain-containing protein n=1 Tax=Penicillium oxalicum (strain 114-2 / CGMCC 5302) TaxID=933388 RepID=S7ZBE7_PENO1|nr:hypothetical protein PDE_00947 [Penicillium oxalicum 114-2]
MNGQSSAPKPPQGIFLISYARTASNLLCKILALEEQPRAFSNESNGYYFRSAFLPHWMTGNPYRPLGERSTDEVQEMQSVYQQCYENLERESNACLEQGKIFFFKEHAPWFSNPAAISEWLGEPAGHPKSAFQVRPVGVDEGSSSQTPTQTWSKENHTILCDEILQKWRPVFLIRHPALAFPSYYRATLEVHKGGKAHSSEMMPLLRASMTLRWNRFIYDWACRFDPHPLMLDADDVILNQAAIVQFCEDIGLDSTRLRFSWDPSADSRAQLSGSPEEYAARATFKNIFGKTLLNSSGILRTKSQTHVDIAAEAEKWKTEFGPEMAAFVEKAVREAMPDYEYLRARRSYERISEGVSG